MTLSTDRRKEILNLSSVNIDATTNLGFIMSKPFEKLNDQM